MVSLRAHLKRAARARWINKTEAERKEHSAMMSAKRWPKSKEHSALENPVENRPGE